MGLVQACPIHSNIIKHLDNDFCCGLIAASTVDIMSIWCIRNQYIDKNMWGRHIIQKIGVRHNLCTVWWSMFVVTNIGTENRRMILRVVLYNKRIQFLETWPSEDFDPNPRRGIILKICHGKHYDGLYNITLLWCKIMVIYNVISRHGHIALLLNMILLR